MNTSPKSTRFVYIWYALISKLNNSTELRYNLPSPKIASKDRNILFFSNKSISKSYSKVVLAILADKLIPSVLLSKNL